MKKVLYSFIIICLSVALASCHNEKFPTDGNSTGKVDLSTINVSCDYDVEVLRSTNIDNFIVTIIEKSSNNTINQWSYSKMPEVYTLTAGSYILKIESGSLQDAAWDSPYYAAEKEFQVNVDKITAIGDMVCVLKNVKVTVEFSQELLAVLGNDVKVNVALGKGQLDFKKDETRAGYFAVEEVNNRLYAYFSGSVDGYVDEIYNEYDDVKAGQWRILRYSLKQNDTPNVENGSFVADLSVDVSCNVVEKDVQVDVNEDVIEDPNPEPQPGDEPGEDPGDQPGEEPTNGPVIKATTFNIKEPQIITPDLIIEVVVTSEQPLTALVVDIDSETLTPAELESVGLAAHFDLANPGDLRGSLEGLGFPVAENVVGKQELSFDITPFAGLLAILGSGSHNFVLTATDNAGNSSTETLTLIVQ